MPYALSGSNGNRRRLYLIPFVKPWPHTTLYGDFHHTDTWSVLWLLQRVDMCDIYDVSKVRAASIFGVNHEDRDIMYLRNFGNIAYIHTV